MAFRDFGLVRLPFALSRTRDEIAAWCARAGLELNRIERGPDTLIAWAWRRA